MNSELATNHRSVLDNVFRLCNKAGFDVKYLEADSEFKPLLEPLQDELDIDMTFADPQDHVKQAERNDRTVKERVRATFWRLPFESLPKILIRKLAQQVTQKINYVCPKGGISKEYSPNNIMTHERLDYNRHFKIPLGSAVKACKQSRTSVQSVA